MPRALFALIFVAASFPSLAEQLIINRVSQDAQAFVYELPDGEGRTEAVRYIQYIHDHLKAKAEILDAGASSEAVLREKLQHGFLLYTTFGDWSKLLRLASEPIGWSVRNGEFQWADLRAGLDGLRVIAAGKNPYAAGNCVIYAAGSNAALVGINAVFHGPKSFYVYRNGDLLKDGNYDGIFQDRSRITQAGALADVEQFFATLERVHPNLLARRTPAGFVKLQEETRSALTANAGIAAASNAVFPGSSSSGRIQDRVTRNTEYCPTSH